MLSVVSYLFPLSIYLFISNNKTSTFNPVVLMSLYCWLWVREAYLGLQQRPMMDLFAKTVNSFCKKFHQKCLVRFQIRLWRVTCCLRWSLLKTLGHLQFSSSATTRSLVRSFLRTARGIKPGVILLPELRLLSRSRSFARARSWWVSPIWWIKCIFVVSAQKFRHFMTFLEPISDDNYDD